MLFYFPYGCFSEVKKRSDKSGIGVSPTAARIGGEKHFGNLIKIARAA
jgi:hypothetical protein